MPQNTPACPVPPPVPPGAWACHLHLTNDPRAPRIARHTVRLALLAYACTPELTDTAELLTSELVSNAVKHSDGPVSVRLRTRGGVVRVGVMDNHPELPDPLPRTPDEDFGRGLFLVDALADTWGRYPLLAHPRTAGWKVVWFELATARE
ncbi:ATP-binding protein [Streptomyces sp. NBC_01236]|uniref:ATP-binding protein n=1 Tax=Streptomyces sp. NBC_01236 TaxID=2903789 RepID=UPI002E10BDC9|nr:ATP-binding protein [Streptomyces sp. NBC_01236]